VNLGKKRKSPPSNRHGAALIEFSVCLPIFFLITMATIETCRMVYLRQSLKIAAYECARVGIVPGMTDQAVRDQCDLILLGRKLSNYQLRTSPESIESLKYGDLLTVTIEMSADKNAIVGSWFYRNRSFQESVTIMAEY
jgi:Flp pilus assembly protein TadG